jgi:hypothetical protein
VSRDSAGIYTFPIGAPLVVPDTTIESLNENTWRNDVANELTNSLDRNGRGGMLAPFRIADGSMAVPGLSFLNDPNCGIWRESADVWHIVAGGANQLQFSLNGTRLENNLALGAFTISNNGTGTQGISVGAGNIVSVVTPAAGDAIRWTNLGATPRTGYLFSSDTTVGIFDSAGGGGNGMLLIPGTNNVVIRVNSIARATFTAGQAIQAAGNITIPPASALYLDGGGDTYIQESSANVMTFAAGGVVRLTVASAGITLSANTALTGTFSQVCPVAGGAIFFVNNTSANPYGFDLIFGGAAPNNTTNWIFRCSDTVGNRALIMSNGGLWNYSANNANLSDARMKQFSDGYVPSARGKVRALEIRLGRYLDEDGPEHLMLTAQQVREVFPDLIVTFDDKGMLGVKEHGLWMQHLKATQEHDDEIEELKARIDALERKLH